MTDMNMWHMNDIACCSRSLEIILVIYPNLIRIIWGGANPNIYKLDHHYWAPLTRANTVGGISCCHGDAIQEEQGMCVFVSMYMR